MGGICVGHTEICNIDEGCKLLRVHEAHDDRHKNLMVRVASPLIPGVFQPTFHYDCAHNRLRSAIGRVISVVPKPSLAGVARLKESAAWLMQKLPFIPAQDIHKMPSRYSGGKKKRYEEAVDKFLRSGLHKGDAHCAMFVKSDRLDAAAKVNPDPRAIQFRGAKYCVALAQYLQPIEHFIYEMSCFCKGVPHTRNIAKGLNQMQRAELLRVKMSHFISPVVISLDASRFDKHVGVELLKVEHSIYSWCNPDKFFRFLLTLQLLNIIHAKFGLKYLAAGRRMSGDMNTALGNCLLMLLMLLCFCLFLVLEKWDCLDDGDDCLLIIELEDLQRVQANVSSHFLEYGMVMKLENVAYSLHEVVFCKSSVIEVAGARVKFVRDYRVVISKALTGIRHWQDPNYRIKVLRANGLCELVLNLGVPVLQSFAMCIIRNVGRKGDVRVASDQYQYRVSRELKGLGIQLTDVKPREVTWAARESFATAFKCDISEQMLYERFFDAWTFDVQGLNHFGDEWDVQSWLSFQSSAEVYPVRFNGESKTNQTEKVACQATSSS